LIYKPENLRILDNQLKDIFMGRRRDRLDKRRAKQVATRRKNAPRKAKERARKAARTAQAQDNEE